MLLFLITLLANISKNVEKFHSFRRIYRYPWGPKHVGGDSHPSILQNAQKRLPASEPLDEAIAVPKPGTTDTHGVKQRKSRDEALDDPLTRVPNGS